MSDGGVIGAYVVPTRLAASGTWRPSHVARRLAAGRPWPNTAADPYFANVTHLYHFESPGDLSGGVKNYGSAASADLAPRWYKGGSSTNYLQSTYVKSGNAAYCCGPGNGGSDYNSIMLFTPVGVALGAGDWTIEGWYYIANSPTATVPLFDLRTLALGYDHAVAWVATDGTVNYYKSSTRITSASGAVSTGAWHHIAVCRASGTTRAFVDGAQVGSNWTDSTTYTAAHLMLGTDFLGDASGNHCVDEFRITVGTARYSGSYTPPSVPFPDR